MSNQAKRLMITLLVVKGNERGEIDYTESGGIKNENIDVTVEYGTVAWENYLNNLRGQGFVKVQYKSAHYFKDEESKVDQSLIEKAKEEVFKAFAKPEEKKTQAQEIAELKAKIEALISGNASKEPVKDSSDIDDELTALREEYTELNDGKSGHHKWGKETLREKIDELKAK